MRALFAVSCSFALLGGCKIGGDIPDMVALADGFGTNTCAVVVECENNCTDEDCIAACERQASVTARPLVDALRACVDNTCPEVSNESDAGTSYCEYDPENGSFVDAGACDSCVRNAQTVNGACRSAVLACSADT